VFWEEKFAFMNESDQVMRFALRTVLGASGKDEGISLSLPHLCAMKVSSKTGFRESWL